MESITAEQAKKQEGKQVGISLSGCICDIINGRINEEEVEEIIAMTGMDISRKEGLEAVIDFYKNSAYWEKCPEEAAETCRRLWGKGKPSTSSSTPRARLSSPLSTAYVLNCGSPL